MRKPRRQGGFFRGEKYLQNLLQSPLSLRIRRFRQSHRTRFQPSQVLSILRAKASHMSHLSPLNAQRKPTFLQGSAGTTGLGWVLGGFSRHSLQARVLLTELTKHGLAASAPDPSACLRRLPTRCSPAPASGDCPPAVCLRWPTSVGRRPCVGHPSAR